MQKTIAVNGYTIRYFEAGQGSQDLLLLHGNSLAAQIFIKQVNDNELHKHFRILAPDLLGHGDSESVRPPYTDYQIAGQAQMLADFCRQLRVTNPVLLGHSLGGNVLIETLKLLPDAARLILVGSMPAEAPFNRDIMYPNPTIPLFFQEDLTKDNLQEMNRLMYPKNYECSDFLIPLMQKCDGKARRVLSEQIAQQAYDDQLKFLQTLTIPVDLIVGKLEQVYNYAYIFKHYKGVFTSLHLMNSCGHLPFYEQPELFRSLLISILL